MGKIESTLYRALIEVKTCSLRRLIAINTLNNFYEVAPLLHLSPINEKFNLFFYGLSPLFLAQSTKNRLNISVIGKR